MENKNTYGINYTDKKLLIVFNDETHNFDLTQGDLPDFWYGFESNDGRHWDVNFYQEDETCEPSCCVYQAKLEEDGQYEIDTSDWWELELVGRYGTAKEYFEAWDASSIVTKHLAEGEIIGGRFVVSNILPPIADKVNSQNMREVKEKLQAIIASINECGMGAWNADLENTVEAVALEDYYGDVESDEPTVKYNGWYEELEKLLESL